MNTRIALSGSLALLLGALLALPLGAQSEQNIDFVAVKNKRLNSQEVILFPAKKKVPGMLWGTNLKYTPGMHKLIIRCGVEAEIEVENAEGDDVDVYTDRNRVELWQYNDSKDWVYKTWFKFASLASDAPCKSLMDSAFLMDGSKRLFVNLKIRGRGLNHRNVVEKWQVR